MDVTTVEAIVIHQATRVQIITLIPEVAVPDLLQPVVVVVVVVVVVSRRCMEAAPDIPCSGRTVAWSRLSIPV